MENVARGEKKKNGTRGRVTGPRGVKEERKVEKEWRVGRFSARNTRVA